MQAKRRPLDKAAPTPRKDQSVILDPSSLHHSPPETLVVLFKIISHRSWDELHRWHEALSGSHVEHVLCGIYVLIIPQGGSRELAE
jgi:hypothetical protein